MQEARQHGVSIQLANALPGVNTDGDRVHWGKDTTLKNQVQLSTYPDTIGGNIEHLAQFVDKYLDGVVHGVHVLPFYPSSADRGFAPLTYREVDPQFGTWEQVRPSKFFTCVTHVAASSSHF